MAESMLFLFTLSPRHMIGGHNQMTVQYLGHAENLLKHIRLSIRDCALNCPNAHCRFNITSE